MGLKRKSKALLLALSGLLLTGCNLTYKELSINDILASLRKGFTLTGSVTVTTSYWDSTYEVPDAEAESTSTTYTFTFVYQNDDDYTGVDRRFYQVVDGESTYLFGENSFDYDGYVGIRYLDYDNTLQTTYGVDSDGEKAVYALNGLLNPFEVVTRNDFTQTSDTEFSLSVTKSSVFYAEILSVLDDYVDAVSFETANFVFENNTLNSAHFESYNVDSTTSTTIATESDLYHNAYVRYNYSADFNFSDIGTANAKDMVKIEEEKEENQPLADALSVMKDSTGFTYRKRQTPYTDGEYSENDEVVTIYYNADKLNNLPSVYSQTYSLTDPDDETYNPTSPSTSDYLLYNPYYAEGLLYVYQYDDTTTSTFTMNSSGYTHLNGEYTYDYLFSYMNFASFMSANIFTYNEDDDSYSPNIDNMQYIAGECFLSNLDYCNDISSEYVTDVKVYVEYSETYNSYVFDEIVVKYNRESIYTGQVVFEFYDFDNSSPAFDISLD